MPIDEQSVLPRYRGLHWWGAVAVALVATAIGAAVDATRIDALGTTYQVFYLIGCVGAALLVRRRALFTAAVQPPLIALVVSIVVLYALNSDLKMSAKTLIFKLALPIASSFPSMAVTFVLTLAVVVARWYLTRQRGPKIPAKSAGTRPAAGKTKQSPTSRSAKSQAKASAARARAAESSARARERPAARAEDERRTQPTRRRADADAPVKPGRRRADRSGTPATQSPQPTEPRQPRPRPRPRPQSESTGAPRSESTYDPAAQRPRSAQQGPAVRRTAGAAARAAGLDLTADVVDDPAPRRRPPVPPAR